MHAYSAETVKVLPSVSGRQNESVIDCILLKMPHVSSFECTAPTNRTT